MSSSILIYTSAFCPHSWRVERFLRHHQVDLQVVSIDRNPTARQQVMAINDGYASVPTLIFPDGTHLTEPSLAQLTAKLGIKRQSFVERLRSILMP